MSKFVFFLLIIPSIVNAEIWHCSYKSTEGTREGSISLIRDGKYFYGFDEFSNLKKEKDKYVISKENKYSIILVFQGISDFIIQLDKVREDKGKINFVDINDLSQWKGNCLVTNIKIKN